MGGGGTDNFVGGMHSVGELRGKCIGFHEPAVITSHITWFKIFGWLLDMQLYTFNCFIGS